MSVRFVDSDGCRIAYEVSGTGAPLILLHGGFQSRKVWEPHLGHLTHRFTTIAVDLRGHGASDAPGTVDAYCIARLCADVLAVADACGIEHFHVWGYSYGANLGRYLAARSSRVRKFVMVGVPFGAGATGDFREFILRTCDHWQPILQAQASHSLDPSMLSTQDRVQLATGKVAPTIAWLSAMLDWPAVMPEDLRCRTLWLVGSNNTAAMLDAAARAADLPRTKARLVVLPDLNHEQELTAVTASLAAVNEFLADPPCAN